MSEDDKKVAAEQEAIDQQGNEAELQETPIDTSEGSETVAETVFDSEVSVENEQETLSQDDSESEAVAVLDEKESESVSEHETEEMSQQSDTFNAADTASTVEVLADLVIDSAEAANSAARNANDSSELVIGSVSAFNEAMAKVQKRQYIMFWVFIVLMVIGVSVSGVLMERFTQSAIQADEIMLTVGKRVVQMDADIKRVENLRKALDELSKINGELNQQVAEAIGTMNAFEKEAQKREESGIERSAEQIERIAKRIEIKFDRLVEQTTSLDQRVKLNEVRFAEAADELASLRVAINEMRDTGLLKKLDALIQLEQQRYYDQQNQKAAPADSNGSDALRYPKKGDELLQSEGDCKPVLGFPC
ncbi:hypothetical protein [Marinobacterium sp. xm-a-152]|uniref:hypothetical protein n=1 Tax=Marinobacterium sp. xm-a-152 TaxID=2497733 RepID=UPI0015682D6F|nr:hypothetical protein [Marinobacterium sp. xm-a-152]NRP14444.1 hypothetical protein [Marinobacterium sp. xm-a-152]